MALQLKALEKNILKYRALQMILLLHEMESLRRFVIGSIRSTDKLNELLGGQSKQLPEGTKKPFKKALDLLVKRKIISKEESDDIQEINEIRNTIGHQVHHLVDDISNPDGWLLQCKEYDYGALDRLEGYRKQISKGLGRSFVLSLSFDSVAFEQAELTYKEELTRLKRKIDRQFEERFDENA